MAIKITQGVYITKVRKYSPAKKIFIYVRVSVVFLFTIRRQNLFCHNWVWLILDIYECNFHRLLPGLVKPRSSRIHLESTYCRGSVGGTYNWVYSSVDEAGNANEMDLCNVSVARLF